MFQASHFEMSFTKIILIYYFVISTLSTQTLIQSQIDLGFHCFYLEITWRIHGILCHKRSGNPATVLTHFKIFITKICMKKYLEFGIKTLEFGNKNLEKTWNLVFGNFLGSLCTSTHCAQWLSDQPTMSAKLHRLATPTVHDTPGLPTGRSVSVPCWWRRHGTKLNRSLLKTNKLNQSIMISNERYYRLQILI